MKVNGYPIQIIENTIARVRKKNETAQDNYIKDDETLTENSGSNKNEKEIYRPHMSLPYGGNIGNNLVKKLKHTLQKTLPENVKPEISVKGTKLASYFNIKDEVADKHTTDFIYSYKCGDFHKCKGGYVGETRRRKQKRIKEHGHCDTNSAIYKHSRNSKHEKASEDNFTIIAINYPHWRRRKICEAMYIRDMKPELNKQVKSHQLFLFK